MVGADQFGAALSTLAAARAMIEGRLPRPAALYTFGSPRVGDATFTTTLRAVYHCRVVNDNDIVATVPPPLFFRHDGELHHPHVWDIGPAHGSRSTAVDLGLRRWP